MSKGMSPQDAAQRLANQLEMVKAANAAKGNTREVEVQFLYHELKDIAGKEDVPTCYINDMINALVVAGIDVYRIGLLGMAIKTRPQGPNTFTSLQALWDYHVGEDSNET